LRLLQTSKALIAVLVALVLCRCAYAQVKYAVLPQSAIEANLATAQYDNQKREHTLFSLFERDGCTQPNLSEMQVRHLREPDVLCSLRGASPALIVVGAHFDHVSTGMGVVDNWTGAALLPALYDSVKIVPRTHTFVFAGFSGEEIGEVGSAAYAKKLAAEKVRIDAMVNFDSLGLTPTKIWASRADKKLLGAAARVLHQLGMKAEAVNVDNVGSTDSESFRLSGFPAITFHSVTNETFYVLHSPADQLNAVNLGDYYDTYRFLACYLAQLDNYLGRTEPER
jgi:hypothetical protein